MHVRATRETLMAALTAKQLNRTLTTALPPPEQYDAAAASATGVATWDAPLGGGFPRGQLSEIVGPLSSGGTSALLRLMAAATERGELVALVDALDRFDPGSAAAAGVALDQLLWVRGSVTAHPGLTREAAPRAIEQALKALTLILQAGNFGLVAIDLRDGPLEALRRLPFTTWMRVQRMLEGQPTVCVLLGREPMARSAAGLTLRLTRAPQRGLRFVAGTFSGLDAEARIIRARARAQEERTLSLTTEAAAHV